MNLEDAAWLAGIFEGEGSWHLPVLDNKHPGGAGLKAKISNCDSWVVKRSHLLARIGSIDGPMPPSGYGKLDRWQWRTTCTTDTYAFFLAIEQFLSPRRIDKFYEGLLFWLMHQCPKQKLFRVDEWDIRQIPRTYGIGKDITKQYGIGKGRISQIRSKEWVWYLSGAMRNQPNNGFDVFDDSESKLKEKGWKIISPATMDRENGFHLIEAFKRDFDAIKYRADGIIMLPGWEDSIGANAEKLVAERLGRKVLYYQDL